MVIKGPKVVGKISVPSWRGNAAGCYCECLTTIIPDILGKIMFSNIDESKRFLLHNYESTTSDTIATDPETQRLWRDTVVLLATHYEFLMHGIMAIAAHHLAHDEFIPHKK
jgi:hypothetical protein